MHRWPIGRRWTPPPPPVACRGGASERALKAGQWREHRPSIPPSRPGIEGRREASADVLSGVGTPFRSLVRRAGHDAGCRVSRPSPCDVGGRPCEDAWSRRFRRMRPCDVAVFRECVSAGRLPRSDPFSADPAMSTAIVDVFAGQTLRCWGSTLRCTARWAGFLASSARISAASAASMRSGGLQLGVWGRAAAPNEPRHARPRSGRLLNGGEARWGLNLRRGSACFAVAWPP